MKIKKHTNGKRRKITEYMDAKSLNDTIICLHMTYATMENFLYWAKDAVV
jgi:hypothetical protein